MIFSSILIVCAHLVPETAWIRRIMHAHVSHIFPSEWLESQTLAPLLHDIVDFPQTPSYFRRPLHGFIGGGTCRKQALMQASSMRYIMRMFQCDAYYRENSFVTSFENVSIPEEGLAVDIGCGTGDSTIALSNVVNLQTIGFDLSRPMVRLARERTGLLHRTADAAHLPLDDASVAVITAFALFHEMPRAYARLVLQEAGRVVQPNGIIAVWDQNPDAFVNFQETSVPIEPFLQSYLSLNVTREIERAGFRITRVTDDRFMRVWIGEKKESP